MRRTVAVGILGVLLACAAVGLTGGCASEAPRDAGITGPDVAVEPGRESEPDEDDAPRRTAVMLGRSVMAGWFEHWGAGDGEHERDGVTLLYREVASPPDLGWSAAEHVAGAPRGTVVFFKPCFVDFWAATASDIDANVRELVGYAEAVLDAADGRGLTVILGTALPRVSAETSPALVETHRRYARELERLANGRDDVLVFDLNGVLAAPDGSLRADFAASPDDSHLNDAAYEALDARLFELLGTLR